MGRPGAQACSSFKFYRCPSPNHGLYITYQQFLAGVMWHRLSLRRSAPWSSRKAYTYLPCPSRLKKKKNLPCPSVLINKHTRLHSYLLLRISLSVLYKSPILSVPPSFSHMKCYLINLVLPTCNTKYLAHGTMTFLNEHVHIYNRQIVVILWRTSCH